MPNSDQQILTDSIIQQKTEHLLSTLLGDELVMMDLESGNYLSLNKTGAVIWAEIEQPVAVAELIKRLTARFDIDETDCLADTVQYLQKMREQNIISVS
jgi:hypothetical protein